MIHFKELMTIFGHIQYRLRCSFLPQNDPSRFLKGSANKTPLGMSLQSTGGLREENIQMLPDFSEEEVIYFNVSSKYVEMKDIEVSYKKQNKTKQKNIPHL